MAEPNAEDRAVFNNDELDGGELFTASASD